MQPYIRSKRGQSITLSLVFRNDQPTEQVVFIPLCYLPFLGSSFRTDKREKHGWFDPACRTSDGTRYLSSGSEYWFSL